MRASHRTLAALLGLAAGIGSGCLPEDVALEVRLTAGAETPELSDDQLHYLAQQREDGAEMTVARLDRLELPPAGTVRFTISAGVSVDLTGRRVETGFEDGYGWLGENESTGETGELVVDGDEVVGTIRGPSVLARVTPLEDGLHAVVRKFAPLFPAGGREDFFRSEEGPGPPEGLPTPDSCEAFSMIVAVTSAARAQDTKMEEHLGVLVEGINKSYESSGVRFRMELVDDLVDVDYAQTTEITTDLERFVRTDDPFMAEIHAARAAQRADVAVLVTARGNGKELGWAASTEPTPTKAFAVLRLDGLENGFWLAHEIGHLLGASHAQGHCLGAALRTIMGSECPGPRAINRWSNPNVLFDGMPLGSPQRNNVEVMNWNACLIAGLGEALDG